MIIEGYVDIENVEYFSIEEAAHRDMYILMGTANEQKPCTTQNNMPEEWWEIGWRRAKEVLESNEARFMRFHYPEHDDEFLDKKLLSFGAKKDPKAAFKSFAMANPYDAFNFFGKSKFWDKELFDSCRKIRPQSALIAMPESTWWEAESFKDAAIKHPELAIEFAKKNPHWNKLLWELCTENGGYRGFLFSNRND